MDIDLSGSGHDVRIALDHAAPRPQGATVLVGTFDLLNVSHLSQIRSAAARCEHLTLAVLSDNGARHLLNATTSAPAIERARLVTHIREVDSVVVVGPETNWRLPDHDSLFIDARLDHDWPNLPWAHANALEPLANSTTSASAVAARGLRAP